MPHLHNTEIVAKLVNDIFPLAERKDLNEGEIMPTIAYSPNTESHLSEEELWIASLPFHRRPGVWLTKEQLTYQVAVGRR